MTPASWRFGSNTWEADLQHWYGYHSETSMGYPYAPADGSRMYLTRLPKQLEIGDWLWVVEGDARATRRYSLVDCFEVAAIERGPFAGVHARFGGKVASPTSLLKFPVGLNRADAWFADLHAKFITKQKFVSRLTDHPEIVRGLKASTTMAAN